MTKAYIGRGQNAVKDATSSSTRIGYVVAYPSVEDEAERVFDLASEHMSEVGAVVTFARSASRAGLLDLPLTAWEGALAHDLRGPFLAARRGVEEFLSGGAGGRIILVSRAEASLVGRTTREALLAFARSVTKEVGRRQITCNVVLPSTAATPGGVGAEALASAMLFLAGAGGAFVSGDALQAG